VAVALATAASAQKVRNSNEATQKTFVVIAVQHCPGRKSNDSTKANNVQ